MQGGRFACTAAVWLATAWSAVVGDRREVAADAASPDGDAGDFVVVGVSPVRAESIAAHGQAARHAIEATLLGVAGHRPWVPPCTVHVHADRAAFARAVGGAPAAAGGATSIEFVGDVVSLRRIDVVDCGDDGVPPALAHELVHVVLADRFPAGPPPRWADEGLATLFDEPMKQRGHDADYHSAAARGQAWRLADLMTLDLDPADAARQRIFYGQSAAVVRWLLDRADGPTFLRFLDDAAERGVDRAIAAHYAYPSVAALEQAWLAEPVISQATP